ncbi:hypothetical protein DEU56DRAFT_908515 [Suillus clintonianus]|uniref:uncharacterized protein n=1 Tax=Suillus clintonianus TaxID=1904413 RepID=UPI001B867372|nr:uncharacterized protein DEU56DRAFT_908515 [Suillus clintonianus]KAG2150876.1 hypothetical protein DEU56DRAFT_908515 [Suillus clintonianus]
MSMTYAIPTGLMRSDSPSVRSLGNASHLFQVPFSMTPSRDTNSPPAIAHDGMGLGIEFWQHMHCITDNHTECQSALMIAKTSHRAMRNGRVAAQARVDQFMLLLRALSEELEDWKWKEQEAEQTILSLAQKNDTRTVDA